MQGHRGSLDWFAVTIGSQRMYDERIYISWSWVVTVAFVAGLTLGAVAF